MIYELIFILKKEKKNHKQNTIIQYNFKINLN